MRKALGPPIPIWTPGKDAGPYLTPLWVTKDPDTGVPVERVYTAPAIHFKGSGFHNTDYGSNRRAKAGSGGSESSESSSASKSENAGSSCMAFSAAIS